MVLARTTATADVAIPLNLFICSPKIERSRISQRATYHTIAQKSPPARPFAIEACQGNRIPPPPRASLWEIGEGGCDVDAGNSFC
jgi:hypothetical protein